MKRRTFLSGLAATLPATYAQATTLTLNLHGSTATVDAGNAGLAKVELIRNWITKSADAVFTYYGKFPVPMVDIYFEVRPGTDVDGGRTMPGDVPHIEIEVGRDAGADALLHDDWVMVHEMIHLAFPWMNMQHNWMAEGLAVYVESIARVQAGHLPPEQIWGDFTRMMPKGLPKQGEGGFETTINHGRTYWGGAMFCLLADIRIRQETDGHFGLQHALRAINGSRDFRQEWDFLETLKIGDAATGRTVLVSQYGEMREKAVVPDLTGLWRDLGITTKDGAVTFDAAAPLASIRKAIETPIA